MRYISCIQQLTSCSNSDGLFEELATVHFPLYPFHQHIMGKSDFSDPCSIVLSGSCPCFASLPVHEWKRDLAACGNRFRHFAWHVF